MVIRSHGGFVSVLITSPPCSIGKLYEKPFPVSTLVLVLYRCLKSVSNFGPRSVLFQKKFWKVHFSAHLVWITFSKDLNFCPKTSFCACTKKFKNWLPNFNIPVSRSDIGAGIFIFKQWNSIMIEIPLIWSTRLYTFTLHYFTLHIT